ncbi:beta-glucosidase A-like [Leptopilina heterotoma]|uniref:beta-glucosidase A-like n=1 Tax=Leptopilina heterotoma TaxID=63436 RepID=UPI001CA9305E|nr:beta-glucosidase A-like [Leptopilina heterotoma]
MIIKRFTSFQFITITILISVLVIRIRGEEENGIKFPKGFAIGAATSAYQIEGAWNISDKGENDWDYFTHHQNSIVHNKSTGDVACNSYYLYKDDVKLLKNIDDVT